MEKVEELFKIKFDSEPVYGDNYIQYITTAWLRIFKAQKCQKKKLHASVYQ